MNDQQQTSDDETNWQVQAEEYLADLKRARADFENYRKRTEARELDIRERSHANALLVCASVLDDFRRAFAHVPDEQRTTPWVQGLFQTEKHLEKMLATAGLIPIPEGGVFDPTLHEAIAYVEHPDLPEGTIIDTLEQGWKMGNRIVKPAKVRVSRGTPTAPSSEYTDKN